MGVLDDNCGSGGVEARLCYVYLEGRRGAECVLDAGSAGVSVRIEELFDGQGTAVLYVGGGRGPGVLLARCRFVGAAANDGGAFTPGAVDVALPDSGDRGRLIVLSPIKVYLWGCCVGLVVRRRAVPAGETSAGVGAAVGCDAVRICGAAGVPSVGGRPVLGERLPGVFGCLSGGVRSPGG